MPLLNPRSDCISVCDGDTRCLVFVLPNQDYKIEENVQMEHGPRV